MARAITLIRSASLSDVAEYAYAATAPAESRLIFLAGACPLNKDGSTAAIGDFAGQAAKAEPRLTDRLTRVFHFLFVKICPGPILATHHRPVLFPLTP